MAKMFDYEFGKNNKVRLRKFEKSELPVFLDLVKESRKLTEIIRKANGAQVRAINLVESISEPLFCILMDPDRFHVYIKNIRGNSTKGDIFDIEYNLPKEIKGTSSLKPAPTTFSPKEVESETFLVSVADYMWGEGNIEIFRLFTEKLKDEVLNSSEGTTFQKQQEEKRRPRITIQESKKHLVELVASFNFADEK